MSNTAAPRYNTRTPKVTDIVLFTPNPSDTVALSNSHPGPIAAIITRVWSDITVNLKIIPDNGPMQDRSSVGHFSANNAGYNWQFVDEYYKEINIDKAIDEFKRQPLRLSSEPPRRSRMDQWTPAERAIYDAMQEVEKIPAAATQLTEAVILLKQAQNKVADWIDDNVNG
jgi:hypothetical protein